MTNTQLYLSMAVPMLFNAVLIGILFAHMNSRFDAFERHVTERLEDLRRYIDARFDSLDERLTRLERG
jgi:hypothetical protein